MSDDQVRTRSKTKLKISLDTDPQTTRSFNPQHRSTEQFQSPPDPFQRSSRVSRSPVRTPASATPQENSFQFPTRTNTISQENKDTEIAAATTSLATPNRTLQLQEILHEPVIPQIEQNVQTQEVLLPQQTQAQGQSHPPLQHILPIPVIMANITLTDSLTAGKTPATPKFLCPSIFNPCSGSAASFIKQYERTAAANGWDNALKISYLESFLEGAASLWIQRYVADNNNAQKTWPDIKNDFLREFESEDIHRILERRLYERKQLPNESIKSYYYDLQNIFGEFDPTFDITNFRKFFENRMQRNIYQGYRLIADDNMDWGQLKQVVSRLEDIFHQEVAPLTTAPVYNRTLPWNGNRTTTPFFNVPQQRNGQPQPTSFRQNGPPPRYERWPQNSGNPTRYNGQRNGYTQRNNWQPDIRNNVNQFTPRPQGRNTTQAYTPNTRTPDGRPKCYICNRAGHYAGTYQANRYSREKMTVLIHPPTTFTPTTSSHAPNHALYRFKPRPSLTATPSS